MYKLLKIIFGICLSTTAVSQSIEQLRRTITEIAAEKEMKFASIGISVVNTQTQETVIEYNPYLALAPASALKIITTATGLLLLGSNFTFETRIEYDGMLSNGVISGNLYIRGGGDPTLGVETPEALLEEWSNIIQSKGIKKIQGQLIADERIFDIHPLPNTWIWEDIGNYYGTLCSGLNFQGNEYKLFLKPAGMAGGSVMVLRTEPEITGLQFYNEMKTGAPNSGDNGYIFGAPYSYERSLRGTIPAGVPIFMIRGAMPDPPFFLVQQLETTLRKKGISINGGITTFRLAKLQNKIIRETTPTLIHSHKSAPLAFIVRQTNLESINLYAEAILRIIGKQEKGKGTTENGIEAILEFWKNKGISSESMVIEDGSGLSRFNAISAKTFTDILLKITKEPVYRDFLNSLPIAGLSGTLRKFGMGSILEGRVFAKTGYMKRARCMIGYLKTKSEKELAFAIMFNNFQGDIAAANKRIEKILLSLVNL